MLQCNITAAALQNRSKTTNSVPLPPVFPNLEQVALVHQRQIYHSRAQDTRLAADF
jgi:hypothetical protein